MRKLWSWQFAPSLLAVSGIALLAAQTQDTVIRSDVREVLLDVVVRHKNLSLATKLRASDFTVLEDGVPQKIKAFRLVGGSDTRIVPATPEAPKVTGPLETRSRWAWHCL